MDKIKLLLVEDEESFSFVIKSVLEEAELYEIRVAKDGVEGLSLYKEFFPDIIVVDIELPIMNGDEMVRKIRETNKNVPIIFATGKTTSKDFIAGMKLGADAYIKKPYMPEELDLQIRAILKRITDDYTSNVNNKTYKLGKFVFNAENKYLLWNKQRIDIQNAHAVILKILSQNMNKIVSKDDILSDLGKEKTFYALREIDVYIHKLRKLLKPDNTIEIKTIRGCGYIMSVGMCH